MTERPPVAEMKRLLFARIAELRELEGPWLSREGVDATPMIRAFLDANEAFLKRLDFKHRFDGRECTQCGLPHEEARSGAMECQKAPDAAQIQALYEALCGGEK